MQELEQMISIYHTAYITALILTCVFFVISVFLFFKFDIWKIINMKTGRGAKKTIQKMEEVNARTGKLRQDMTVQPSAELKPEDRIAFPVTAENLQVQTEAAGQQAAAGQAPDGSQETALPGQAGGQAGETTLLSGNPLQTQQEEIELPGFFRIKKEVIWTHTEVTL